MNKLNYFIIVSLLLPIGFVGCAKLNLKPKTDYSKQLNSMTYAEQKNAILKQPSLALYLSTLNREFQEMLIESKISNIQYINNIHKDERMQLFIANKIIKDNIIDTVNMALLDYVKEIERPVEYFQLTLVDFFEQSIPYINNPTELVKINMVKKAPGYIKSIPYPSKDVQLAAVKAKGYVIKNIKNPDEEVMIEAVKNSKYAIAYIDNPNKKVQMASLIANRETLKYIKNPIPSVVLEIFGEVRTSKRPISYIESDSNIHISLDNGNLKILNKTNNFVKINSIAEYYGSYTYDIEGVTIAPKSNKTIVLHKLDRSVVFKTKMDKLQYGFAMEYKLSNSNKIQNIFKVNNVKIDDI